MLINNTFKCTQDFFENIKGSYLIPLTCSICQNEYTRSKTLIKQTFNRHGTFPIACSKKCLGIKKSKEGTVNVKCKTCNTLFLKDVKRVDLNPNHFCSKSCSATFNNKNKTYGTRRSKLENYLEEQLTVLYPNIEILYSSKTIINSELDIYIPSLKLAFEIQGIFHYEPIFGQEKLSQIKKNDLEKIQKCNKLGIKLVHVDTRNQKSFSIKSSKEYLSILEKDINTILFAF